MRWSERLGFGPQQHLFPRSDNTEHDADLDRWTVAVPIALNAWLKETFDRKRSLTGVYAAFTMRDESWLTHVLEGIEFVGRMDIADRAMNGLRRALLWDNRENTRPSLFGHMLAHAYDNPQHSDHNHEHSRRHERWLEAMMLHIPELRHSHSIFQWVDSAMLFSYFHDIDQLISLERNAVERTNFSVKKAHGPAAAVMLLVLHERYAKERKVSVHDAWELCAGAALMSVKHDEPETFAQAISGMRPAYRMSATGKRELLHGSELRRAFDNNELDLFTIAPSQLIEILTDAKSRHGFLAGHLGSRYGLHPQFEAEYARELAELAGNDLPILKDITDEEKMSFRHAAEAAVQADVFDMVAPPVESMFRLLNTQYSWNRPFFRAQEDPKQLLKKIMGQEGNLSALEDSDVRRLFWHMSHLEHIPGSIIAESAFVRRVNREHAMLGAMAVKQIGSRIMRGDYTDIDRLYRERKCLLARKTLAKADVPRIPRLLIYHAMQKTGDDREVRALLEKRGELGYLNRYTDKTSHLDRERDSIIEGLTHKPPGSRTGAPIYQEDEERSFERVADMVIDQLRRKYGISEKEFRQYQRAISSNKYSDSIPFTTYDSLGGTPRTLVRPING